LVRAALVENGQLWDPGARVRLSRGYRDGGKEDLVRARIVLLVVTLTALALVIGAPFHWV
jgi:hypothetical protein